MNCYDNFRQLTTSYLCKQDKSNVVIMVFI